MDFLFKKNKRYAMQRYVCAVWLTTEVVIALKDFWWSHERVLHTRPSMLRTTASLWQRFCLFQSAVCWLRRALFGWSNSR